MMNLPKHLDPRARAQAAAYEVDQSPGGPLLVTIGTQYKLPDARGLTNPGSDEPLIHTAPVPELPW